MKTRLLSLLLCLLAPCTALLADEGMWMLSHMDKQTRRAMKERGLKLSPRQLYHPHKASLKDAVVSFGGFCSGVVVSAEGLVLTNHHCGFESVQQHSTVQHDYLTDGFVARTRAEELPCPDLYVRFLLRQEDVTRRVLSAVRPGMDERARAAAIDSVSLRIQEEIGAQDSTLLGVVDAYYTGNEYWLSVYRDYDDVRLVYAPPSSVGKFGWDQDNWEWPRHTGDFCVFRIYAAPGNRPAPYSPQNVPYHPRHVAPISLQGYREGDFCMTLGYPGSTERYLSSFGIEEMVQTDNQARIDLRGLKQDIWKEAMAASPDLNLKYAAKYDESSNYWKNSIGMNRAIRRLKVVEKRRQAEADLRRWIRDTPSEHHLLSLFSDLELAYESRRLAVQVQAYLIEAFFNAPELVQQALTLLNFDFGGERQDVVRGLEDIVDKYAHMDLETDRRVFATMLDAYRQHVHPRYWPRFYQDIDTAYGGDSRAFVDTLYARSLMDTPEGLTRFLEQDSTYNFYQDPAIDVAIDLLTLAFDLNMSVTQSSQQIARCERQLDAAMRRHAAGISHYPDANSTMRLSFGTVRGYAPADGAWYNHFTTTQGIFEKVKSHRGDPDFDVQPQLLDLLRQADFGRYADRDGEMHVCFLSDNDITGGNSGSAMFNARGELLGLAFDGNWEAMSSDLCYEPRTQRTIGVDIRYVLFIMERYGQAAHLVSEMDIR